MSIRFTKMHGLGNDFLVVDRRAERSPPSAATCVALCDRRRGVGADGVLSILPATDAPLAMHVTNADGSVAEMCGNGLRCVVVWAVGHGLLPAAGGPVATGRGVLDCRVVAPGEVRVDMGAPILAPASIPALFSGARAVGAGLDLEDTRLPVTCVSMGNPHAVAFIDDPAPDLRALAERFGPGVETHERFPQRANAGFARVAGPRDVELVVWERGAGITEACGTGACASVVAASLEGRLVPGVDVRVRLPGGPLTIRLEPDYSRVWMTGPAVTVFEGAIDAG